MKAANTAALLALWCLVGRERPTQVARTVDEHEAPPGELVTDAVVEMSSSAYARPPTSFLPGRVTPHEAPKARKTPTGFSVDFDSRATLTTPTVYERAVIMSGGFATAELYAFDATTGASRWAIDLHDTRPSSPACEHGVCLVSTESCTLFAIAAGTGTPLWSAWLGDPPTCAPTIANDLVFVAYQVPEATEARPRPPGATHALAALELRTGKILWQRWLDSDVISAPVATAELVHVTTVTGIVIELEQATGKVCYAIKTPATGAHEDEVTAASDDVGVGSMASTPLAADHSILFGTLEGEVVRIDPKSGKVVGTYAVGSPVRSQPVAANGWIYVSTDDSRLVAIDTKDPTVTGRP